MKKNIALILICLFLLSMIVHFLPVWEKGYSFSPMGGDLILARNFALTDEYKIESENNIVLSSDRIKDEGIVCNWGNELTSIIYGQIFKTFGFHKNLPLYISLVLWALTGSLLFLLVLKLFNLKLAVIFGLIDIFVPVIIQGSLMSGFYEFAILFFVIGLLFYLYKKEVKKTDLVLASFFFGLASLARNAFLVSFIPFVIYDFWKNRSWKRAVVFVLPFVLLWGIYLAPDYLEGKSNAYFSSSDTSFGRYGHLFPDPYTFHFEKDQYIEGILGTSDYTFSEFLLKYDYSVSFKNKLIMYFSSIKFYPKEFSKLIVTGGPLIILFLMAGLVYLYRKKRPLFNLFVIWGIVWYVLLVVLTTNNWDHFLELRFPIVLLISLGVYWLIDFILKLSIQEKFKYLIILIFSLSLFLHFVQANKWMLHEEYNTSGSEIENIIEMANSINRKQLDKQNNVIAISICPSVPQALNYYTDNNIIYFDLNTVKRLLGQNKLSWAFEQFGVTKIAGFNFILSQEIIEQTDVENIISLE